MKSTMDKYLRSVRRRLALPKDVKERVMSDFSSSIAARREAGLSEEEILTELGSPKKAAAELNEQMRELTYRKSPWRFLFLILAIVAGGWLLLYSALGAVFQRLLNLQEQGSASVGIIGGADGPTSIIVATTTGVDWDLVLMAALLVAGIVGFLRLRKCKQKK